MELMAFIFFIIVIIVVIALAVKQRHDVSESRTKSVIPMEDVIHINQELQELLVKLKDKEKFLKSIRK